MARTRIHESRTPDGWTKKDPPLKFELPIRDVLTLRMLVNKLPVNLALWWDSGNWIVGKCARRGNGWEHCEVKMAHNNQRGVGVRVRPVDGSWGRETGTLDRCAVCGRAATDHPLHQLGVEWELHSVDYDNKQVLLIWEFEPIHYQRRRGML